MPKFQYEMSGFLFMLTCMSIINAEYFIANYCIDKIKNFITNENLPLTCDIGNRVHGLHS